MTLLGSVLSRRRRWTSRSPSAHSRRASLAAAFPRRCLPSPLLAGTRGVAAPRACSGPCLQAFYQKHDPSKLDKVDEIYEKYPAYKLVAILKKK